MKNVGKWLVILIVLVLIYVGWKWWSGSDEQADAKRDKADPSLLLDRVWIDKIPEAYTDYMNAFLALEDHPVGIFQKASAYHIEAELFQFKRKDNKVHLLFPQTGKKKSFSYKISYCDEVPPFDLCLDLSKNPWAGPKRYYGDSEEHVGEALEMYRRLLPADAPDPFSHAAQPHAH